MARPRSLWALGAAAFALAACGGGAGAAGPSLAGRTFISQQVTVDGEPHALADGTSIWLTFNDDGTLGAQAGCNSMGGSYVIRDGRLIVDAMSMTEMGCDEPRHAQDDWLASFLGAEPRFTLDGDELTLESDDTVMELLDRETADPDQPLVGTLWQLDTIFSGTGPDGAASSVPLDVVATVTFTADQVAVTACNTGGGDVQIGDGELTFGAIAVTRMACDGDIAGVERTLLQALEGTVTFEIDAGRLTITHPAGGGLGFAAVEQPDDSSG